jgi:hypothetical protein
VFGIYSVTSIIQLVFGARIVHQKRKGTLTGGNYAPALNPAVTSHVETGYGVPQPQAYASQTYGNTAYNTPVPAQQPHGHGYSNPAYSTSPPPASSDYYKPPVSGYASPVQQQQPQEVYSPTPGGTHPSNSYELPSR